MITTNMTVRIQIDSQKEREEFEMELDSLMEALVDLVEANTQFSNLSMGADLSEKEVEISMTGTGETQNQAVDSILELIRTATKDGDGNYEIEMKSNRVVVNRTSART